MIEWDRAFLNPFLPGSVKPGPRQSCHKTPAKSRVFDQGSKVRRAFGNTDGERFSAVFPAVCSRYARGMADRDEPDWERSADIDRVTPAGEPYDAWVLANFVDAGGRLVRIPAQRKKKLAVLRWLSEEFQPGRRYPEEEVNRIISRRHPDFATLRRYMVDEELMQRRSGIYWRTGSVPNLGHDPESWPAP